MTPAPFLKWVGGKRKLLDKLVARMPKEYHYYYEPFLGGGALFFHLQPKNAVLSDLNYELINAYKIVKACPELLMQELSQLQNTKEHFLELRALDRDIEKFQQLSAVERAARFIFLNKTCYNGLHRVNSKGEFNVPYGKYKNPTIFSTENILACSRSLQGVALSCDSFDRALGAGEGDFVYFDPPYVPIEAVSDFTSYTREGFGMKQQDQLLELCIDLDKRGVKWMQSNSSGMIVRRMYKDFNIESVTVTRTLQQTGGSRVDEVIITNY